MRNPRPGTIREQVEPAGVELKTADTEVRYRQRAVAVFGESAGGRDRRRDSRRACLYVDAAAGGKRQRPTGELVSIGAEHERLGRARAGECDRASRAGEDRSDRFSVVPLINGSRAVCPAEAGKVVPRSGSP